MTAGDVPLFAPAEIGLDAPSWDDLDPDAAASAVRCRDCRHPVTADESRAAELGPTCAARLGRAVAMARTKAGPEPPPA